jgi:hypothetical protein
MTVAGIAIYGRGRITIIFKKRIRKLIRTSEQEALIAFLWLPKRKSAPQAITDADKPPRIVTIDSNWLITGLARPTLIPKNR